MILATEKGFYTEHKKELEIIESAKAEELFIEESEVDNSIIINSIIIIIILLV